MTSCGANDQPRRDESTTLHWPLYKEPALPVTRIDPLARSIAKLNGTPFPKSTRKVILVSVMAAVDVVLAI
jgi:hypothetical protein